MSSELLTPNLTKRLYKAFKVDRPKLAVDDPEHCLACSEAQETHQKLYDRKGLNVDHFNVCYMSIESFSEDALLYYMPKLLELLLLGHENKDNFRDHFLSQLIPNKFGNRFKKFNHEQVILIIEVLELFFIDYSRYEETWDYELEIMTNVSGYKESLVNCKKALGFLKKGNV